MHVDKSGAVVASNRKEKIVNVEPPTVLNEQELVAGADAYCSHAAPRSGGESCPKVARRVVVELAQVLEQ